MFAYQSRWFVLGALVAITLFGTVSSLVLQWIFGNHVALIAVGPVICVSGVLIFMAANFCTRTDK